MQKEITIQDIDHLLHVIGDSIKWASEHEERAFLCLRSENIVEI